MLYRYKQRSQTVTDPPGGAEVEALAQALGVMNATARILIGRGVTSAEEGFRYFKPGPECLRDPFLLLGMEEAAARIEEAVESGERITVYGDYDVDGVCAAAILTGYLRDLGADCGYYIPDRHTEGYGMNGRAIESLKGTGLLVSVDCGVTNAREVARARELGMDVIVTDHHECPDELPDCVAVVNPKRPGQAYGFSGLCGAGVALKLIHALGGEEDALGEMDLAALATVADIVPLTDENRAIVRMGLERINRAPRPGIQALREVSGLGAKPVKAGNVAFMLAPRINAGGRMDLSGKSVEMMLTGDIERARAIAAELNEDNAGRVKTEEGILQEAVEMVESGYAFATRRAVVLYRPHWNTGVTGIVASRLVERYHRPVFLFGDGEGACYGSGRSVPGVHLYNAMKACSSHFLRFGGHEQAAGCAIAPENLEAFASAFDAVLNASCGEEVFLPMRQYDAELVLGDLSLGLARDMEKLEPTGFGNPRPVFLFKDVPLAGVATTADGKHLRMRLGGREGVEGIAFRQGGLHPVLASCETCDALAVPDVNEWMGRERVQAVVEHIRLPQHAGRARAALALSGPAFTKALSALSSHPAVPNAGGAAVERVEVAKGMDKLADACGQSCWGTLALCFTAVSALRALEALEGAGCLERIYVDGEAALQAARGENALVFAPDVSRLPLHRYRRVFVFDGALFGADAGEWAARLQFDAACYIMEDNHAQADACRSRDGLLEAYRAMKAALARGAGPGAPCDWAWLREAGIAPWRAEVSARIFLELGLLQLLDGPPWIGPAERAGRADLASSALYRRLAGITTEV